MGEHAAASASTTRVAPEHRRALRRFRRRWILANTIGVPLAIAPGVGCLVATGSNAMPAGLAPIIVCAAAALEGVVLGALQAPVLRTELPNVRSVEWIAATAAGRLASCAFLIATREIEGPSFDLPIDSVPAIVVLAQAFAALVCIGALRSSLEWYVLRRHVHGAWVWPLANALGWVLLVPLLLAVSLLPVLCAIFVFGSSGEIAALVSAALALPAVGALLGAIGGATLEHSIRERDARSATESPPLRRTSTP